MFEDYREVVFTAYKERRDKGLLSPNLQFPSPAKLKSECMLVYKERILPKDQDTLRAFFGARNDSGDYSLNIKNIDIDRFRPLVNFLKGASIPDERIVELLAWLLDFNPRPHALWNKPQTALLSAEAVDNDRRTAVADPPLGGIQEETGVAKNFNPNFKKAIYGFIAASLVVGCSYLFYKERGQQCMYWNGDYYQQVSCDAKIANTMIIGLNTFKLDNVRRITRPDTLSSYSIRRVFYAKTKGKVEFYTDSSDHPTDPNKRMLPMTPYIYEKYVLGKK